jgi:hypothetical protein
LLAEIALYSSEDKKRLADFSLEQLNSGNIVPPGEERQGFDDRFCLFSDAVEVAKALGEEGKPLMDALEKLKKPESQRL